MGVQWERTDHERKVCKALEEVAVQVGAKSIQAGSSSYTHLQLQQNHIMFT